ncbi:MAG: DUF3010 family protein [Pseudomonadota bacterium]
MNGPPLFDFRDHLRNRPFFSQEVTEQTIFGAAVSAQGLVLCALHPGEFSPTLVERYATIVVGPVEKDWPAIATEMERLAKGVAPGSVRIFLRVDKDVEWNPRANALVTKLESVFPGAITKLPSQQVAAWFGVGQREIRSPNLPEKERWCFPLIDRAVETALYAELERRCHPKKSASAQPADKVLEERTKRSSLSVAAAAYSKPYLSIVALKEEADGQIILDNDRCATFVYEARDAAAGAELSAKLRNCLSEFGIEKIYFRSAADRGYFAGHALCYKSEAILQMVPGLEVESVTSQSIAIWLSRDWPTIPAPQSGFDVRWRNAQQRAIELGTFVLSPQFAQGRSA